MFLDLAHILYFRVHTQFSIGSTVCKCGQISFHDRVVLSSVCVCVFLDTAQSRVLSQVCNCLFWFALIICESYPGDFSKLKLHFTFTHILTVRLRIVTHLTVSRYLSKALGI